MKTTNYLVLIVGILLLTAVNSQAQIKIGKNPTTINPSSLLEVESDNKGVLLPRVALQSAVNFAPLAAHVAGMIVYNTATAGTAPDNVVPGFYYNDGTRWLNLADLSVTNAKLAANAVTTDKILDGTIKNEDLNKTDIPLSGFAPAAVSVDLGSQNLINVKDPINPQDAATKKYVDDATAAINTLENGKIYLGNASNEAREVAMSGDVTMDNAGVTTIGASKVLTGMIADGTIITADLADNAVETAKIKNAAVTPAKIEKGADNTVLVTDGTGAVVWLDKNGFGAVADQTTIVGEGTTASKFSVKDGGITTTQILDGTVATIDLADDAVTTGKIANGTIKNEDLNKTDIPLSGFAPATVSVDLGSQNLINVKDPINPQDAATKKYVDDATAAINTLESGKIYLGNASNVATEVAMTGDVTMDNAGVTTIGASKVLTGMIANGTIIAEDIAVGAVTTDQILDGTILVADLANNAVETAKIKDLNVTTDKLAADAVTTEKILNANVTTAKIADSAVTTEKIASGGDDKVLVTSSTGVVSWINKTGFGAVADQTTIVGEGTTDSKFSVKDGGITTAKLADGAVTSAKIEDGTIVVADLADNAVETAKIKNAAVTPAKIAPGIDKQILVTTGVSPAAVEWFTPTNTLTATNGQLVSTVNGLASTPAVNVLISADNGLTATNGNVQLGGVLTTATTITTDATNTLALEGLEVGANTDKMLVVDVDGVVKSVDASARNINEIVKIDAAYTVLDKDYTILANATSAGLTVTIPEAVAANKGRILVIRKTDETNNELTFSESIKYSESTSFNTLNYLSTIRIQSDGTAWYKID